MPYSHLPHSGSSAQVGSSQGELENIVNQLLEINRELSRRLTNLEDAFDAQSVIRTKRSVAFSLQDSRNNDEAQWPVESRRKDDKESATTRRAEHTSGFDFESDLEVSRPYRRAQRDTMDFSLRSSVAQSNAHLDGSLLGVCAALLTGSRGSLPRMGPKEMQKPIVFSQRLLSRPRGV